MAIKLNNFVNININHANQYSMSGSRNICTLIFLGQTEDVTVNDITLSRYNNMLQNSESEPELYSLYSKQVASTYIYKVYIDTFFNNANGNSKLSIIQRTDVKTSTNLISVLNELSYDRVVIASNLSFADMKDACDSWNKAHNEESMNKKIFLAYIPCKEELTNGTIVKQDIENLAIKYGNEPLKYTPFTGEENPFPILYELIEGNYIETSDQEINNEKTYYIRVADASYEEYNVPTLYERSGSEEPYTYTETQDTSIQNGKTYYTKNSNDEYSEYTAPTLFKKEGTMYIQVNVIKLDGSETYYTKTGEDVYNTYVKENYYFKTGSKASHPGYLVDNDLNVYSQITSVNTLICYIASTEEERGNNIPIIQYNYKGIEMAVGAYLTKINIDNYESVQDYAFTQETFLNVQGADNFKPVEDNDLAVNLIDNSYNFTGTVASKQLNLGGNDSSGYSLVNQFMLICLHQTLTEKIWGLLQNKIKYNTSGLNSISSFITQEMKRYVDNGYLSTNKTWTGEDLYNKNGILIIKKNTPLTLGYKFVISPLSTLSLKDIQKNKMPLISILIADAYAIRKIEIDGTVF